MIWNSWSDFFTMGGYALYVWGSVLVFAAFVAGELAEVVLRRNLIRDRHSLENDRRERQSGHSKHRDRP